MSKKESSNEDGDDDTILREEKTIGNNVHVHSAMSKQWQALQPLLNFSHSIYHGLKQLPDSKTDPVDPSKSCSSNDILLIKMEMIDKDIDEICIDPFIRIHLCNATTGKYLSRVSKGNRKVHDEPFATTHPASREQCVSIMSMEQNRNDTAAFRWGGEEIIIKQDYEKILHPNAVLLFEVLDCGTVNPSLAEIDGKEAKSIMWGYLKPISRNNGVNVGTRTNMSSSSSCDESMEDEIITRQCRLQLFKWQKDIWFVRRQARRLGLSSPLVPKVYLQYLRRQYNVLDSSLYISIGPTPRPLPLSKAKGPEQTREGEQNDGAEDRMSDDENPSSNLIRQYERLPEEKCLIPDDTILFRFNHNGAVTTSFSNSGELLAVASKSHQIYIYNLRTGGTEYASSRRHHEDILDIAWSMNDSIVSCASLDGTISIHLLQEPIKKEYSYYDTKCFDVLCVEPPLHPASLIFYPMSTQVPLIITGLSDGSVSLWNITRDSPELELLADIQCHAMAVRAIETDSSNGRVYTGDDNGKIVIWKPTSNDPIRGIDFEVLVQLDGLREITGKPISYLSLDPAYNIGGITSTTSSTRNDTTTRSRQLLVTIQKEHNCLFVYDLTSHELVSFGINTETKQSAFTVAKFSPDGRFVVGGTKNGKIVLMDSSGIHKKVSVNQIIR